VEDLTRLATAARDGDQRALESLLRHVQADVWRYCVAMVGPAAAEDTAQDALLRVVRAVGAYRAEAPARPWVMAITRRACLDTLRERYRRRDAHHRFGRRRADDTATDSGWTEIQDLLGGLDADRRDAFVLTQLLGFSYDEAATAVGCPIGTIRSRVARARLDLLAAVETAESIREPRRADRRHVT
jgi:RNA polymerase sigma-70 factor (ECF subfamily)